MIKRKSTRFKENLKVKSMLVKDILKAGKYNISRSVALNVGGYI